MLLSGEKKKFIPGKKKVNVNARLFEEGLTTMVPKLCAL